MKCSRNTIYLALEKEREGNLTEKKSLISLSELRKETGFGKRRLSWYLASKDNRVIPESTIGKILKSKKLTRKKKRVKREYHTIKYQWDKILSFEQLEMDTKEIADKRTLPKEIYEFF